jgi:hypothetical protein
MTKRELWWKTTFKNCHGGNAVTFTKPREGYRAPFVSWEGRDTKIWEPRSEGEGHVLDNRNSNLCANVTVDMDDTEDGLRM